MPFGLSYNEAANPRAAPLQAWITAAATTGTRKYSHRLTLLVRRQRGGKKHTLNHRIADNDAHLALCFILYV